MTQRFFYADPLAAAWMSKHFGMTFINDLPDDRGWSFQIVSVREISLSNEMTFVLSSVTAGNRFYVHPKSLHLLEPQDGDLVVTKTWGHLQNYDERIKVPITRIMQRGGVFFMWPESETSKLA
jgi:hypothetical protein